MFYENLKLQIKILRRDRLLWNGYLFICAFIGVILTISIFNNPTLFFSRVTEIIFYASVMLCTMSFIFLIKARWLNIHDTLEGTTHQQNIYQKMSIITLLILFIVIQIEIIMMMLINGLLHNNIALVIDIIMKYYLFNVLTPMLTIFLITTITAMIENYRLGAILLGLVCLLSSPLMGMFEYRFPLFIPIDKLLYYIKLPFSYFIYDVGRSIDYLYGFQNEFYKLALTLFWIVLLIAVMYKKYFMKSKMFSIITVLVLGIIFSSIYIPQSIGRNDHYSFKSYADYNYYEIVDYKNSYKAEDKYNYSISDYQLDIKINHQLNVDGKIRIESFDFINQCQLTLYHGYKIKSIKGENILSYKQSQDHMTIDFKKPTKQEVIEIQYSGYNENLYSNYQAVLLPGYFPWYPMAGMKQVYITDNTSLIGNQGYNPYNRISNASFDVKVNHCGYQLVTNLNEIDENHYQGQSDSLTLIGGNTVLENNGKYLNSLPLYNVFYNDIHKTREDSYQEAHHTIHKIFGIDIDLSQKRIIAISTGLEKNNQYSGFSEFNDYLIVPYGGIIFIEDIIEYYAYKNTSLNPVVKDAIILNSTHYKTQDEFINILLENINNDLQYYKNKNDNEIYKELLKLKEEVKTVIKNKEVDSYLKNIGKELFKEE